MARRRQRDEIVCIVCPVSCFIEAEYTGEAIEAITGASCEKGRDYVRREIRSPERVFTGTVRVSGGQERVVSVKTDRHIPRSRLLLVAWKAGSLQVSAPVRLRQVLAEDVAGTGANLVATHPVRAARQRSGR